MSAKFRLIQPYQPIYINAPTIFLAGPSPRHPTTKSWRPAALQILEDIGFDGIVLSPEWDPAKPGFDWDKQVEWEYMGLEMAQPIIAFWVPRSNDLPGYTTNVEFGRYVGSGRAVYGRPDGANKTRYLDWLYYRVTFYDPHNTLQGLLEHVVERALATERKR